MKVSDRIEKPYPGEEGILTGGRLFISETSFPSVTPCAGLAIWILFWKITHYLNKNLSRKWFDKRTNML